MILLNESQNVDLAMEIASNALVVAILLLIYGVFHFFFRRKKDGFLKFIRHFLLPFTFTSGFVVYFIGYQVGNTQCNPYAILPNILESLFSTTRLFILGNDLVELEAPFKHAAIFHAMFSLTAALAAFIFISVMASVFFKDWLIRLKIRSKDASENHFFFGINQSALALAIDLLKSSSERMVAFVNDMDENENQQLLALLPDSAYVVKNRSFLDSISLQKEEGLLQFFHHKEKHTHYGEHGNSIFHNLRIIKTRIGTAETHLYFLSDNEDWNIEHAKMTLNELKNHSCDNPVRIHIATYAEIAEKHFAHYTKLSTSEISVIIHHYATIVSRQLIAEHHPVDCLKINTETASSSTDFNVLIIGFGQLGTNVLRKLIEQGQFVGSVFHAIVIDKYMNILQGRFEHLYPGIMANYDIRFVEAEVGNSIFYKEIRNLIESLNYLVISLGDDNLNIQTAMEILEINSIKNKRSLKIFIKLENESHWKETLSEFKNQIFIFGESDKVFSENNILQSKVEKQARIVHAEYCELYDDNRSFDEISRHEQLSNISVAENLSAKVKLLGYDSLESFIANFKTNDEYKKSLSDIQKLNLSIGEHLRWNAFHFIHGWRALPFDKIQGKTKEEKHKNRKNTDLRLQSCLTTWERLAELSKIIGNDMQKGDADSVEHLYDFINYNPNNYV